MKKLVLLTLFLSISVFGIRDRPSKKQVAASSKAQSCSNSSLQALVPAGVSASNQQQSAASAQVSQSLPSTDPSSLFQETGSASSSRSSSLSRHSRNSSISSSQEEGFVCVKKPLDPQSNEREAGTSVGGVILAAVAATAGAVGAAGRAVIDAANSRPVRNALGRRTPDMLRLARSGESSGLPPVDLSHDMDRAIHELLKGGRFPEALELLTYCKQKNVTLNLEVAIGSNGEALSERITIRLEILALIKSDVDRLKRLTI